MDPMETRLEDLSSSCTRLGDSLGELLLNFQLGSSRLVINLRGFPPFQHFIPVCLGNFLFLFEHIVFKWLDQPPLSSLHHLSSLSWTSDFYSGAVWSIGCKKPDIQVDLMQPKNLGTIDRYLGILVTFLDLFGMVKWPFQWTSNKGIKSINRSLWITWCTYSFVLFYRDHEPMTCQGTFGYMCGLCGAL